MASQYYLSSNEYPAYGLSGLVPWGWQVQSSVYNESTNETEIAVHVGYEGEIQLAPEFFTGDVASDPETNLMSLPAYAGSAGPIRPGGFPPPPK